MLSGQPQMSGRAFKYFTQPMCSDFNLRGNQNRSHPERSEAKPKDAAKPAVTFATGFLATSLGTTASARRTQALQKLPPRGSHRAGARYAGNDCRAGQARGQLREWRVQARQ